MASSPNPHPTGPRHLRVVLASPGDVQAERELVQGVLEEVNKGLGIALNVRLDLSRWETDAYPGFHADGGQGHLDAILKIEDCDLLIGIFWTRFGRKIKTGEVGTEHEIRNAIKARESGTRPQIMLYFSDSPIKPSENDEKQSAKVKKFKSEMCDKGLYWTYEGPQAFERFLRTH